jgi:hypothetical protein
MTAQNAASGLADGGASIAITIRRMEKAATGSGIGF